MTQDGFIPPHGGYQNLRSFQKAEVVYDATVYFCRRFISKRDRTYDQMTQAARSGKQNIVEGSQVSGTSKEFEIKLTNVARGSLEEILNDYRDFLRTNNLEIWDKNSKEALYIRKLSSGQIKSDSNPQSHGTHVSHETHDDPSPVVTYEVFRPYIETRSAGTVANIIICLIHQTNYLLDQQLRRLEKDFIEKGGLRESMTRARIASRNRQRGD